ncbi:MAG: nitroreductase [Chloroflexi bacterium]|nr:nitroreductase [Chloroflexota bacterium]
MEGYFPPGNARDLKKTATCNTCTIKLVRLAYRRATWFRVIREPLWYATRAMSAWHRVDLSDYDVRTPTCYGCMRFYKVALKERSATFRRLHHYVNPVFDALLYRFVTPAERKEAQAYARAAMVGDATMISIDTKEELQ